MTGLRALCLTAAAGGLLLGGVTVADAGVRRGDRAAELVGVKDARNKRVRVKSYRGKLLVVTFGASWCKPCAKELPALEKIAASYKGDKRVSFLAINIDKSTAKGKRFVKRMGLRHIRTGFDPKGGSVRTYDPPNMPSTYIVGPRGVVRHLHRGYRGGDEQQLRRQIKRLLNK